MAYLCVGSETWCLKTNTEVMYFPIHCAQHTAQRRSSSNIGDTENGHTCGIYMGKLSSTALHPSSTVQQETLLIFTLIYCSLQNCNTFQCITLYCIALQCITLKLTALHFTAIYFSSLHCTELHCSSMLCSAK